MSGSSKPPHPLPSVKLPESSGIAVQPTNPSTLRAVLSPFPAVLRSAGLSHILTHYGLLAADERVPPGFPPLTAIENTDEQLFSDTRKSPEEGRIPTSSPPLTAGSHPDSQNAARLTISSCEALRSPDKLCGNQAEAARSEAGRLPTTQTAVVSAAVDGGPKEVPPPVAGSRPAADNDLRTGGVQAHQQAVDAACQLASLQGLADEQTRPGDRPASAGTTGLPAATEVPSLWPVLRAAGSSLGVPGREDRVEGDSKSTDTTTRRRTDIIAAKSRGLYSNTAGIALAISGGVDSTAMAGAFAQLAVGVLPVHAVVVDHRLREGSGEEAALVEQRMQDMGRAISLSN